MKDSGLGVRAAGFLLVWVMILLSAATAIYAMAGDGNLLAREMLRFAPPKSTGLPEAQYEGMGRMIADYLTGKEAVFQYSFADAEGNTYRCFQQHEADHMADCRALIRLAGTFRWILGGTALLLFVPCAAVRKRRKRFAAGMLAGFGSAVLIGAAVAVWGIISFDSLFVAFHRLAFTNEGWLMDAGRDMLLRLMPTPFFTELGTRVLVAAAAAALVSLVAALVIRTAGGAKEKQEEQAAGQPVA